MLSAKVDMKYRVRLKTKAKLKIFFSLLFISATLAIIGYKYLDVTIQKVKYKNYFLAEVINRNIPESVEVLTTIKGDYRLPHTAKYPYEARVRTKSEEFVIGSYSPSFMGDTICVGIIVRTGSREVLNYVKVESDYCR